MTREAVLTIARELGIVTREDSLGTYDLHVCDEAFLVGTAAELVPIRSIDGRAVTSCPGPLFREIERAFRALVRRESSAVEAPAR